MTSLKCDVSTCANNAKNCCCRPDIQVCGPCACGCEQTCCGDFEKKGSAPSNSAACNTPNTELNVSCDASNCVFQKIGKCTADTISVAGCRADCESETECASFRMK